MIASLNTRCFDMFKRMDRYYCTKCMYMTAPPCECPNCHAPAEEWRIIDEEGYYDLGKRVPEFYEAHLEEKIQTIHEKQILAGRTGTSVGLISDTHFIMNYTHSGALMNKVLTDCYIPYYFNAGDVVSAYSVCPKESIFDDLDDTRRLFHETEKKCLMARGNHDDTYSDFPDKPYGQRLTSSELYEGFFRFQSMYPDRVFGPTGTYFYAEDTVHKMRYIVLDNYDMNKVQLDWFAKIALDVPSTDWGVVLCTHVCPANNNLGAVPKSALLIGIINAFRRHTSFVSDDKHGAIVSVDFTGRGGEFITWVGGHWHEDLLGDVEGIKCLAVSHDYAKLPERVKGQVSEQLFDILTIDRKRHKVYVTRIGYGEDREFNYEVF